MGTIGDKIEQLRSNTEKLRKLTKLSYNESNHKISNFQVLPSDFIGNKSAFYVPYNNQFNDMGWGCAWRVIQTLLSAYKMHDSFEELFQLYSRQEKLMMILRDNKLYSQDVVEILNKSKFAPEDAANNWAEPFIGKLVCEDKGINSRLFLLNGYPHANAPKEVFTETISFSQFTKILKESINESPVMIDDGYLCMSILGYKEQSQNIHKLLIGDPHIISNKNNRQVGIYKIVCNQKGEKIDAEYNKDSLKQAYLNTLDSMYFYKKQWMVLATYGLKQVGQESL